MGELSTSPSVTSTLLHPLPTSNPLNTLVNLRQDLGTLDPFMNGQAQDMAYGMLGSYKHSGSSTLNHLQYDIERERTDTSQTSAFMSNAYLG